MRQFAYALAALALLAPQAFAQSTPIIDGPALAGPPPAAGSPREAADRLAMRPQVSEARFAQARADLEFDAWRMFQPVLGESFTGERLPRTAALLAATIAGVSPAVNATKEHYNRTRPYVEDRSLLRCDAPENPGTGGAYPTGHGAGGWAFALVLAEVAPARADAILQRGRDFGDSRVICGYHFPSDIEASRIIAAGAVARLHGDGEFRRLLDAARRELARAYR
jgi:acid phosphatase (class A)